MTEEYEDMENLAFFGTNDPQNEMQHWTRICKAIRIGNSFIAENQGKMLNYRYVKLRQDNG